VTPSLDCLGMREMKRFLNKLATSVTPSLDCLGMREMKRFLNKLATSPTTELKGDQVSLG
jgi:hypothetical protein